MEAKEEKKPVETEKKPKENKPGEQKEKPLDPIFLEDEAILPESMKKKGEVTEEEERKFETESNWTETMTENEDDEPMYVIDPEMDEINNAVFADLDQEEEEKGEEVPFDLPKSISRNYKFHKSKSNSSETMSMNDFRLV